MWAITKKATLLTVACLLIGGGSASAQAFRGRFAYGFGRPYYAPFYYDRFWGPYPYSYGVYPYAVRPEDIQRLKEAPTATGGKR